MIKITDLTNPKAGYISIIIRDDQQNTDVVHQDTRINLVGPFLGNSLDVASVVPTQYEYFDLPTGDYTANVEVYDGTKWYISDSKKFTMTQTSTLGYAKSYWYIFVLASIAGVSVYARKKYEKKHQ